MSPYTFLTKIKGYQKKYYKQIRDHGVFSPQLGCYRRGEKDAWEYLRWLAQRSGRYTYDVDFGDANCMHVLNIETMDSEIHAVLLKTGGLMFTVSAPQYSGQRPGGRKLRALPQQLLLLL